jgi:hypothetical protein
MATLELNGSVSSAVVSRIESATKEGRTALEREAWVKKWAPYLPEGLKIVLHAYDLFYRPEIDFPREMLPQMRKVLGRMSVDRKRVESVEDNTIRVYLKAEQHEGWTFSYVRPIAENARCRIVEITETDTRHTLACTL